MANIQITQHENRRDVSRETIRYGINGREHTLEIGSYRQVWLDGVEMPVCDRTEDALAGHTDALRALAIVRAHPQHCDDWCTTV